MNIAAAILLCRNLYTESGYSVSSKLLSQQERTALLQLITFTEAELDRREAAAAATQKEEAAQCPSTPTRKSPRR